MPPPLSIKAIRKLLQKYQAIPLKQLGQHFAIQPAFIKGLVEVAQVTKSDIIVEIGPGLGALTYALAQKAKKVISFEKDKKLVAILKETLKGVKNVQIIHADILKVTDQDLPKNYKLASNLPYVISAPTLEKFLMGLCQKPRLMVLTVQKEFAQRITASPPKMNRLGLLVQFYAQPEIIQQVPAQAFWPQPKVTSALIKISQIKRFYSLKQKRLEKVFFRLVQVGFSAKRKKLSSSLYQKLGLSREKILKALRDCQISPEARPENLSLLKWQKLTSKLASSVKA